MRVVFQTAPATAAATAAATSATAATTPAATGRATVARGRLSDRRQTLGLHA